MKILVSRPDKIGDVILALHGVKQLKKCLPNVQIYMHISEYTRPLVENIKFIDGIVSLDEDIGPYKFDYVVDLRAKQGNALKYFFSNAKKRIGNAARWFGVLYSKSRYLRRSHADLNEAEYNWQLLSLVDSTLRHSRLYESLEIEDFKNITAFDSYSGQIVLMPSVTVSAKGWSLDNWLSLSNQLAENFKDKNISILLGPAENSLEAELRAGIKFDNIKIEKPKDLKAAIGFLKVASFYIGTSTGITHLAAACGLKGIALYPEARSMHPNRWLPFNCKMHTVSLDRNPAPQDLLQIVSGQEIPKLNPLHREKVSAFVICLNEERNINRALRSLSWCDEIVLVDSGSKDKTLELAAKYTDKIIYNAWPGHSAQKQFALEHCTNNWILNIDADEEVSMELKSEIEKILRSPEQAAEGYNICRLIYYLQRWWDKGGWYPEYRLRFFQRKFTHWGGVNPHEKALVDGKVKKIKGFIYHYTYRDMNHQVQALQKHAQIAAESLYRQSCKARVFNLLLNPAFRFFKFYILKRGFLEGLPGLTVAVLESYYTYLKYLTLWQLQKKGKAV